MNIKGEKLSIQPTLWREVYRDMWIYFKNKLELPLQQLDLTEWLEMQADQFQSYAALGDDAGAMV